MNGDNQATINIQNLINIFPVWDEKVWQPLQKKQIAEAQRNLESVLANLDQDEWINVHWVGLLKGTPAVRGTLSSEEWNSEVKPMIVRAILNTATGSIISRIYQEMNLEEQIKFSKMISANLPGRVLKEKMEYLRSDRNSIFIFLIASPAQDLGVNPNFKPEMAVARRAALKYDALPKSLQNALLSFGNSEKIFRLGQNYHLSEEKTSLLAQICGQTLLGLVHLEDLSDYIQRRLLIDKRLGDELAGEIKKKVLIGLEDEIQSVYEPLSDVIQKETTRETIDLAKIGQRETESVLLKPEAEAAPPPAAAEGQPLIIHREEPLTEEKKPSFRGFSFPGFFKSKKTEPETKPAVKVKVETPTETKEKERVVHYSEFRTPITPFDGGNEFINLETFSKKTEPTTEPPITPKATKPETISPPPPSPEKKPAEEVKKAEAQPRVQEAPKTTSSTGGPPKNFLWFLKSKKAEEPKKESPPIPPESKTKPSIEGNIVDLSG